MKSSPKIISRGNRSPRLKRFSKHWLDAVKLSDVSVLADSGSSNDSSSVGSGGGEIFYQVPVGSSYSTFGAGAFVSPWNTNNPSANPPVYDYSESYVVLVLGGHYGILTIENTSNNGWQTIAALDGQILITTPYHYYGGNRTYLEIAVDTSGNWSFWADFGSVGANRGPISPYTQGYAQFGSSAGQNDYLMYNGFSNCGVSSWAGWGPANLSSSPLMVGGQYEAVGVTTDSVLFQDNPPY